jgi:hypothetical protein
VTLSADETLATESANATPGPGPESRTQAREWLEELLANGPVAVATVQQEAKRAGFSWSTVRRAKDELGIKPYREQFTGGSDVEVAHQGAHRSQTRTT